jgi:hypothetical protein
MTGLGVQLTSHGPSMNSLSVSGNMLFGSNNSGRVFRNKVQRSLNRVESLSMRLGSSINTHGNFVEQGATAPAQASQVVRSLS